MTDFAAARAECLRALSIIEQTQITLFQQDPAPAKETLIERIDALQSEPLADALTGMRRLLNDVVRVYNDAFAGYINPVQHRNYAERRRGDFVGVGLKYRARGKDYPLVIGPLQGGPMDNLNVLPGDRLLRADQHDLHAASSADVRTALSGPPDSTVELVVKRDDLAPITLTVTRRAVELHYARADVLEASVGYIKISRFGTDSHERVEALLRDLIERQIQSLVLDLRDNPGGSTRAARIIMSLFDKAEWVYCERYKSGAVKRLPREGQWLSDIPLAVLVNEYSMSSAEILAGALQDYGRAVLIGTPTYGKGLIQKVFTLSEPLSGAIRTTIASYATPSHRLIHGRGLTPDIYVPTAPQQLFKEGGSLNIAANARAFRRQLLEEELRNRFSESEARALIALPDAQLDSAIAALTGK